MRHTHLPATLAGAAVLMSIVSGVRAQTSLPPTLQEGYAPATGARLFYRDGGGRGTPVVFLHAGTGSSQVWEHQIPAFTRAGYRFITHDRRGYGRTTVDGPRSGPGGPQDVLALMDHLKIDRFHVVGTAAGGGIALELALAAPERLRSAVLANTVGGAVQDESYRELGRRLRPEGFESMPPDFRELGPAYRAANPEGTRRWIELEKRSRAPGEPPGPAAPPAQSVTFQTLETIRLPILLLTGGADLYAPPPVLPLFAAHLKGSEIVVVPEAGHSAYWEQPEVFNRAVLDFIRKH